MFAYAFSWFGDFWNSYFSSYGEFKMREIKLRIQVLQAARRLSQAAHAERCHWSKGCNNNVVGHCRKGEPHTMQVMLGVSLRARWDATLVKLPRVIVVALYFETETRQKVWFNGLSQACQFYPFLEFRFTKNSLYFTGRYRRNSRKSRHFQCEALNQT